MIQIMIGIIITTIMIIVTVTTIRATLRQKESQTFNNEGNAPLAK